MVKPLLYRGDCLLILMFVISLTAVALQRKGFVKEGNISYQSGTSSPTPPRFFKPLISDTVYYYPFFSQIFHY